MKETKRIIIAIGIGLLTLIGAIIVGKFFGIFEFANPQIIGAIIAGVFALAAPVLANSVIKYYELKTKIEYEVRQKKIPIYEEFIQLIIKFMIKNEVTQEQLVNKLQEKMPDFIIWTSNDFLSSWNNFKKVSTMEGKSQKELFVSFEKVLHEIRKDVGHVPIGKGELLKLMIREQDQVDKLLKG